MRDNRPNMRDNRPTKTKTIFCVVEGESSMSAFPVTFGEKEFIADIKNLIKAAKTPMFDHIPATDLTLYYVNCPFSSLGDIFGKITPTSQPQPREVVHPMMGAWNQFVGSYIYDTSTSILEIVVEPPQTTAELI
ncbi:MAG: hypothetical protein JOS17DRAFT_781433 [Linnemannia elongata]|nr:MAG: hypothetical protein JOS17DRAFT_781433 [Linnemannia elongata]